MSRLTKKIENSEYMKDYELLVAHNYHLYNKLGKIEDLMEQYNIDDLAELKIALEYYEQTKQVEKLTANSEIDTFKEIQDLLTKSNTYDNLSNELGCPLDVVFKALKEGIVVNDIMYLINGKKSSKTVFRKIIFTYNKFYKDYGFGFGMDENGDNPLWWISLKDYGKNWWLKEYE